MQYPKRVTIELTNKCNRTCKECPRHKMTTLQGYMNKHLYKNIINQLPEETAIVPFFRGESTLHKHFPQFMRMLNRFKTVQLATNGDYLTLRNREAIIKNVSFFSLSLHEESHPNHKHTQFLKRLRAAGIETQVSFVGELENKTGFTSHWKPHVDRIRIYTPHSVNGFGNMTGCNTPTDVCDKPFEDMIIYWNGRVGLCNHDWNNLTSLGNLFSSTVAEVWNSEAYQKVRNSKRSEIATCKNCSFETNKIYGEIIQCNMN